MILFLVKSKNIAKSEIYQLMYWLANLILWWTKIWKKFVSFSFQKKRLKKSEVLLILD